MKTKTEQKPAPEPDRMMRMREVIANTGLQRPTIYKRMKEKRFPQSVPLGGGYVGWSAAEIGAWVEERKADRAVAA